MSALQDLAGEFSLSAAQTAAFDAYVSLIADWWRANVTGLHGRDAVVTTLLADSLALLDVPALSALASGTRWLDLGAGAGIPGIPLALALPKVEMTLLDSVRRKCEFLEAAVDATGLRPRAHVVCSRSEQWARAGSPGREAYAVVLARAVAPLPTVVELAAPLLAGGGLLLASKTQAALQAEVGPAEAAGAACGLGRASVVRLPRSPLRDAVCVVFEKTGATPDWLPRREGRARTRPLP